MSQPKAKKDSSPKRPNPIDIHVGGRLRLRRNLLGLSQSQLGKASGLTFQQIQKYEHGTNRMGASRLVQFARILDMPVSWFFESLPETSNLRVPERSDAKLSPREGLPMQDEFLHRRETTELLRAWYKITDPKQRRKILSLIKSIGEEGP